MSKQLEMFGFKDNLPRAKVPISAERIRLLQKQLEARDSAGAIANLRTIREGLERFERRISHKPNNPMSKIPTVDEQIQFVEDLQNGYPKQTTREMLQGIHDSLITTRVVLREKHNGYPRVPFKAETKGKGAEL